MIDLSNNNGHVDFSTLRAHGESRVYLKRSEGLHFNDPTFADRQHRAHTVGIKVGAYHFARPSQNSPREEAEFFLRLAPQLHRGHDLRHCLDLEDPAARPSAKIGLWAVEFLRYVRQHSRFHAIIYGSSSYLQECQFQHVYAWLWLAAYGRNDGSEHPFAIPRPWTSRTTVAHQFASTARVPGVEGACDVSRIFHPGLIDVRHLAMRHGLHA